MSRRWGGAEGDSAEGADSAAHRSWSLVPPKRKIIDEEESSYEWVEVEENNDTQSGLAGAVAILMSAGDCKVTRTSLEASTRRLCF